MLDVTYYASLQTQRIPVNFSYDQNDPYAVTLTVKDREDIPWTFARELLNGGGNADVKVACGAKAVAIQLSSPGGSATLVFNKEDIRTFYIATAAIVPVGQESERIDWKREFEWLEIAGEPPTGW